MKFKMGIAAALLAGLFGLPAAEAANKTVRVVHPPAADMWPYYIAKKDGIFEKNGLDVQLTVMAVSSNVPAALVSGSADLGVLTLPTLLPAIENGLDLVSVAGGTITDENFITSLMVKPDSTIATAKDVEGKKIGVPGIGAFVNVLFNEWMTLKGADYTKVIFVEVPFPQMFDVLRAGTVDGVIPVEPFASRILGAKAGIVKFGYVDDLKNKYRVLVSASTREYADKNADVIKALRTSLTEAEAKYKADPKSAIDAVGTFIKMPPQALAAVKIAGSPPVVTDAEIDAWTTLLVKQGAMKKAVPASKFNLK